MRLHQDQKGYGHSMIDKMFDKIVGIDVSANAAGVVVMNCKDGRVLEKHFVTAIKKFYSDVQWDEKTTGYFLSPKITKTKTREAEDSAIFTARRRQFVSAVVIRILSSVEGSFLVSLEDYAIDSKSRGLLEMVEISGIIRNHCWLKEISLRLHMPTRVKMWGTGSGKAKKIHMVNAAIDQILKIDINLLGQGSLFPHPILVDEKTVTHDYVGPGTDIADAFHLATLGRYEVLLTNKLVKLEDIDEKRRRVFTLTSKTNPVGLLSCPLIVKPSSTLIPTPKV